MASFGAVSRLSVPSLRRAAIVLLVLGLLAGTGVVLLPDPTSTATAKTKSVKATKRFADGTCSRTAVRFGVVLPAGDYRGQAAAARITTDLSEQLGCPAMVVVYPTQAQLLTALSTHAVELGQLDPAAVVVGDRVVGTTAIGAYTIGRDVPARAPEVRLWVKASSKIRRLADLRGQPVALGPRLTAGGDITPRAALLRSGVRLGELRGAGHAVWTSRDTDALRKLRAGEVTAAITRGPVPAAQRRNLRRLWSSVGPPADVVVARPGIPNAVRRLLVVAVRGLPGDVLAPLGARQGIPQPGPLMTVPLDLYGPVAAQLDELTAAGLVP